MFYHHSLPPSSPKAGDGMWVLPLWPHRETKAPVLPSFSFALINRWKKKNPHILLQAETPCDLFLCEQDGKPRCATWKAASTSKQLSTQTVKEISNSALAKNTKLSTMAFLLSSSSPLLFKDPVLTVVLLWETQPPMYKQGLGPCELQNPTREPGARDATSRKQRK